MVYAIVIVVLLVPAFFLLGDNLDEDNIYINLLRNPFGWIAIVFFLVMFVPSLAVTVRRLHDIGRSGWWVLLFLGGDIFDAIGDEITEYDPTLAIIFSLAAIAIGILSLIWMFTDSKPGSNQWGENPKEMDAAEVEIEKKEEEL